MTVVLNSETLQVLNLLIAFVLPLLVALVTSRFANSTTKSLTLLVLTVLLAFLTEVVDDGGFVVFDAFILFIQNLVVAVTAYFGVLKPVNVAGGDGVIARHVPGGLNVGPEQPVETHRHA